MCPFEVYVLPVGSTKQYTKTFKIFIHGYFDFCHIVSSTTYKNQFIVVIEQYFGGLGITRPDSGK